MRKPIIATNVAGSPEIVNRNVEFLVEQKNVEDLADIIITTLKKWNKKEILKAAKNTIVWKKLKNLISYILWQVKSR